MIYLVQPVEMAMAEPCDYTCCYSGGCLEKGVTSPEEQIA